MNKNKFILFLKRGLIAFALFIVISGGAWLFLNGLDNFHPVVEGEVYRSAQFNRQLLGNYVKKYGIKSVLNLRGPNPGSEWWEREVAASSDLGLKQYNIALSSKYQLTDEQLNEVLAVLKEAPKPLLIHCAHGADRSALVSAIYLRAFKNYSCKEARKQLSVLRGHLPLYRPQMGKTFDKFCSSHEPR